MAQKQSVTIILAADDPDQVQTLQQTLHRAHITNPLLVFHDAQETLDYLSQTDAGVRDEAEPPDLLLLDLTLQHHDGTDLLTHLQANDRTRQLPMMLLTSADMEPEIIPRVVHRERVWVTKPVTPVRFVEALRTLGLFVAVVMPLEDTLHNVS